MKFLKGLVATTLLSFPLFGGEIEDKLISFLQNRFGQNPNIQKLTIKLVDSKSIPNSQPVWRGNKVSPEYPKPWLLWRAVKVQITGIFQQHGKVVPISEKQIFFTDGNNFTSDLISLNGEDWKKLFQPKITLKHYNKSNLISGSEKSAHKIIIFSDPLCPFCQRNVPQLLEEVAKYPKTFAVYYYHLPLTKIHPASLIVTRLMKLAQNENKSNSVNIIINGYKLAINSREQDNEKIVRAFNRATKLNLKLADILAKKIVDEVQSDINTANELEVRGTPTIYFDGNKIKRKDFYKQVKIID
jgi:glutaredoxin